MLISCIPFKFKHYDNLIDMLEYQKCPWISEISMKTLPKIGYIAMMGKQPVAIGFLRRLEGGYAQLDTFATNPFLGSKIRNEGLDLVVKNLLDEAKSLRLNGILAITEDQGILNRAKFLGFNEIPQKLIGLRLK